MHPRPFAIRCLRWALLAGAACAAWIAVAAAQTTSATPPFGERAGFRLSKAELRAKGASPALLEKVAADGYVYFRLLAQTFAARTCYEFRDLRWRLPSVAVHGDAHLQQFVVTDESYGLTDFDGAGFGPAVVDLVRYAASVHVACREMKWSCNPDSAVTAYFNAYRASLDHPVARTPPAVVDRVRAILSQPPHAWLEWADSLMQPMPPAEERVFRDGWPRFVRLMRETSPDRPEAFYRITKLGTVQIGVGSGLEPKTLVRIAGSTQAPDDDLILEVRVTAIPDGSECVSRPSNGGSLQVLMFASLLARRLPEVFGFMPREGAPEAPELWVQSWDRGYRELALLDLRSQADLDELAIDAGTQLAGYFWTTFPEPLRGHQRFAQLRAFEMVERRARDLARDIAGETVAEWERFGRER